MLVFERILFAPVDVVEGPFSSQALRMTLLILTGSRPESLPVSNDGPEMCFARESLPDIFREFLFF